MNNIELDAIALRHDAEQGARLLRDIFVFLGRFVCFPSEDARVAAVLWCIHTHMMDRWENTPRIAFLSPEPGSGKSRALETIALLVPNPVQSVNMSSSYLFRKVGGDEPATILFDEVDTIFGAKAKENEDLRGLLNAGHRRGAFTGRCVVRGKNIETEDFHAYAPVALAGLGWLPETLMTRSIIVRMRKRHTGEKVEQFRRRLVAPEGDHLRSRIEVWAAAQPALIDWSSIDLPAELQDRPADVWESLIAIADLAGDEWPEIARKAAVAFVAASEDAEPSLGVRLLSDLRKIFGPVTTEMSSKAILDALCRMEEAPWGDMHGKPMNERGLAQRLRAYGIRSKTIRAGEGFPKGYTRADLHDNWVRYLPPLPEESATSATSATASSDTGVELNPDGWTFHLDDLEAVTTKPN